METNRMRDAVVERVMRMPTDDNVKRLAEAHGLGVMSVTWEDTGRYKNSAVGPNITDMTIQVEVGSRGQCMPVIRHPNFADKSGDIDPSKFYLLVGNEKKGQLLKRITLKEFLSDITQYLSLPDKGSIKGSLLADRDTHVLTSAQACFLPVPAQDKAEFTPVAFNYQSSVGDPAVLAILATREGTSVTIVDNSRDKASGFWGQRLYFNKEGEKCPITAERLKEVKAKQEKELGFSNLPDKGADMVLLIQVPLKQKPPTRGFASGQSLNCVVYCCAAAPGDLMSRSKGIEVSDVDRAVMGHGEAKGPFIELDNLTIERDTQFPIRVTVQFYKCTSNGVVNEADLKDIAEDINKVYADADFVGSLVTEGETTRVTEHASKQRTAPANWWPEFWAKHAKENPGATVPGTQARLQELFGDRWKNFSAEEAERVRLSGRLG